MRPYKNSGMAVVEVIVALAVITTALVGGVLFLHTSLRFMNGQCDERAAREIAFSQIEILRSSDAPPLENCSSNELKVDLPSFEELRKAECVLDVSDGVDMPGVKVVMVTVRWKGRKRTREVRYTSLVGVRK